MLDMSIQELTDRLVICNTSTYAKGEYRITLPSQDLVRTEALVPHLEEVPQHCLHLQQARQDKLDRAARLDVAALPDASCVGQSDDEPHFCYVI